MRWLLIPVAILGLLAACEEVAGPPARGSGIGAPTPSDVAGASIPPRSDSLTYLCANGQVVQARYLDEDDRMGRGRSIAQLYIDGETVRMLQGASANGVRYIGGGLQWWTRGLQTANLAPLGPGESTASNPGTECRSAG